ncbi:MAG: HAD family phosphatase [Propionibacteriaceae bacterium]|jgi:HAD superfamily hydrolase (TIGR01509 family)|nr:HAD family phosphatase [Propionibacteriaceae bacterium]
MPVLKRPSAVVFDCDGLLMDTESLWEEAMLDLYAKNGVELTPELRLSQLGISVERSSEIMSELFPGAQNPADLCRELVAGVMELIGQRAVPMPGAEAVVAAAAASGVPLAVASNSPVDIVDLTLAKGGLRDFFEVLVTAEDVTHPKPAPDIYLTACSRLNAAPREAIAFEDSLTGVTAAAAAKLKVVAVPTYHEMQLDAHLVLRSLDDPQLLSWIKAW